MRASRCQELYPIWYGSDNPWHHLRQVPREPVHPVVLGHVSELAQQEPADRKRLHLREKVTEAHKRVSNVAQDAGVRRFGIFHDARYRGLYGTSKRETDKVKGLAEGENLFDRAGSLELSAHEFQMQLAATKIVEEGINGEQRCVDANLTVAKEVRKTILEQSGVKLEQVPLEREHIASVKKRLRPRREALPKQE